MSINIIAAMAKNRVIGKNGKLAWHISEDLKYFKKKTHGNAILMGFNTWKSLPTFPEPLPNRATYVVTKNNVHLTRATLTFPEPPELDWLKRIQTIHPDIWICGGEKIYDYYIDKPYINKIYLTSIDKNINGDTYFPIIPNNYEVEYGRVRLHKLNAVEFLTYRFNIYTNTKN